MYRAVLSLCLFGVSGCGLILDFDPRPLPDAPDASLDSGLVELDASISDASTDDGSLFADADTLDSGRVRDGSLDADAGPRRCEETTEGICIRFTNAEGTAPITNWAAEFHWTEVGGADHVAPWHEACTEGFRTVDARTTECEFIVPDPGVPVLAGMIVYTYPTYLIGPACTSTGCPEFFMGYELWMNGMSYSTDPGDGSMTTERRTIPSGMIVVLRINPP